MVKHSSVGYKFIYVLLALSPCVLTQKYLHVASLNLSLRVLVSFNITAFYTLISFCEKYIKVNWHLCRSLSETMYQLVTIRNISHLLAGTSRTHLKSTTYNCTFSSPRSSSFDLPDPKLQPHWDTSSTSCVLNLVIITSFLSEISWEEIYEQTVKHIHRDYCYTRPAAVCGLWPTIERYSVMVRGNSENNNNP